MYGTVSYFDIARDRGLLVSSDGQRSAYFTGADLACDPKLIRAGETVAFEATGEWPALAATNIRKA